MSSPSSTKLTIAALRHTLERKNREVWACTTDWSTVLQFEGDAVAYMAAPTTSTRARIERDAQCIVLLETLLEGSSVGQSSAPYPFRAGKKACNALPTYKRYHAAWLASYKLSVFFETGDDAQLAAAYSHLAVKWSHGEDDCPPQLRPAFVAVALGLLMLLVYDKGPAPGIKTNAKQSASGVAVLRFVQALQPDGFRPIACLLAIEVASHWAHYELDPRPVSTALVGLSASSVAAAAVAHIVQKHPAVLDVASIAKFSRVSSQSCDRKDMGTAQFEFSVNSPMPYRLPLAAAWKLEYVARAQEKLAAGAKLFDRPPIEVVAQLLYKEAAHASM